MKNKGIIKTAVILLLILVFVATLGAAVFADGIRPLDFGDFGGGADYGGDYDGGGGTDFGGDYGGDSGDLDTLFFLLGYLFSDNPVLGTIIIIVLVVFAIIGKSKSAKLRRPSTPVTNVPKPTDPSTLRPMSEYNSVDPNFSTADMQSKISNMFIKLQASWTAKDLSSVAAHLTGEFYGQTDIQLETYRRNSQTNIVERIAVLGVSLIGWEQNDKNDIIIARVSARMADYVIDDTTKEVIRGSKDADKFMEYEWRLVRTKGKLTGVDDISERKACPSCGAPLDINRSTQCDYCGNTVATNDYDWCLANIKGLSQRTVGIR